MIVNCGAGSISNSVSQFKMADCEQALAFHRLATLPDSMNSLAVPWLRRSISCRPKDTPESKLLWYVCREQPAKPIDLKYLQEVGNCSQERHVIEDRSGYGGQCIRTAGQQINRQGIPKLGARYRSLPTDLWARVSARVMRRAPRSLYGQGEALGYRHLRVAIAEYVGSARGVRCTPDQILVVTGAQQGLDLISRILLNPGDHVWVEDPGYFLAQSAFRAAGAKLIPVKVDKQGIDVSAGIKTSLTRSWLMCHPRISFRSVSRCLRSAVLHC